MTTRREFIVAAAASTGALGLGLSGCGDDTVSTASTAGTVKSRTAGLDILILGGTGFIGPHMVRRALGRGHSVTLFNRGRTNTGLFPDVETLVGDRDGKLNALKGRTWDAVIDNSGYVPRHVRDSAQLLSNAAKHYLFVSSISAYANFEQAGIDENYALGTMADETFEEVTGETYGPMKVLAEKAVAAAFPTGTTIVRPGYIVGPGDRTDRWTYWPLRVRAGGAMLVPGTENDPVQFIDARDVARFVIHLLESVTTGTFNAVGPGKSLTMGKMLATMKDVTGADTTFRWADAGVLEAQNTYFPIWAPPEGESAGVHQVSNARARAAGLMFTPLAATVRDTLAWWDSLDAERQATMRAGLRIFETPPDGFGAAPMSLTEQMQAEAKLLEALGPAT